MSLRHLHAVREFELARALEWLPAPTSAEGERVRVLELGAGTGHQAAMLAARGYDVIAVDVPSSAYATSREFPVTEYDGDRLPLEDATVDVVFSSNVLEHVPDLPALLRETRRVLRPGGIAVHVLPTPAWRFWTTMAHPLWVVARAIRIATGTRHDAHGHAADAGPGARPSRWRELLPTRHGERGTALSELVYFSAGWWRRAFVDGGFDARVERDTGLFYTGCVILGESLPMHWRVRLATFAGSACRIFVVAPTERGR